MTRNFYWKVSFFLVLIIVISFVLFFGWRNHHIQNQLTTSGIENRISEIPVSEIENSVNQQSNNDGISTLDVESGLTNTTTDINNVNIVPIQVDLNALREKMIALDEELLSEDLALHKDRVNEYKEEYTLWFQDVEQAHNEWMRLTEIDRKSEQGYMDTLKYIQSLSDIERKSMLKQKKSEFMQYQSVSNKLRSLLENEPVFSTTN